MQKDLYSNLIQLTKNPYDTKASRQIQRCISEFDQGVLLTIKNYDLARGLSTQIHEQNPNNQAEKYLFNIQGPMGRGLDVYPQGYHVAFAGGTGVLPFIDLVAYLLLRVVSEIGGVDVVGEMIKELEQQGIDTERIVDRKIDIRNFKFELYTTFASEEESIGLELIKALHDLCEKKQLETFKHFPRAKGSPRWDSPYFFSKFRELETSKATYKKAWVCGPPMMQELFDKAIPSSRTMTVFQVL